MYTTRSIVVAATLALLVQTTTLQAQDWSKVDVRVVPVTDNVYVLANAGGNIGVLTGPDGVLLIDTGFEQLSEKVTAAVKTITEQPIRLVINTHWHFDHTGGNAHLSMAGALIVAHENVRTRMTQGQYLTVIDQQVPPAPPAALPAITFSDTLQLHWSGQEVQVLHVAPAHTDGDSLVFLRTANVLHVGDSCFNGMYPFIDVNAGGSLAGVVKALDQALTLANDKTRIIPGHGPLAGVAELRAYRDMLATVCDRVGKMVKDGKSRAQIVASKPTSEFDAQLGQSWLKPDTWVGLVVDGATRK
ncbi:MAG: MBL fold metallo-hydrolase [Planctomycetes bacterium]|nr:MBL fold metallo-hydrolase [Planctomycetota bacterium]